MGKVLNSFERNSTKIFFKKIVITLILAEWCAFLLLGSKTSIQIFQVVDSRNDGFSKKNNTSRFLKSCEQSFLKSCEQL